MSEGNEPWEAKVFSKGGKRERGKEREETQGEIRKKMDKSLSKSLEISEEKLGREEGGE